MKRSFTTAAATAAVWALIAMPATAQSSGSGTAGSGSSQQGGGAAGGSGATDQQGSTHGGEIRSGSTGQSGTGQSGTGSDSEANGTAGSSAAGSRSPQDSAAKGSSQDRTFILEAAASGLAEVQLGRLASQKASRSEVKDFGQMMVTDHTKANDQLMKIAQGKGLAAPHSLDPEHKAAQDHLSNLSGEAFDRAYMQHMVKDHQKDIALYRKQATGASDPDVKQFASATLPTLQKHLQGAQEIEQIVGGTTGSTRGTSGTSPAASGSGATPPR